MKDHLTDILLMPVSIVFNYLFASIGFIFLTVLNQVVIGMNFNNTKFDHLIGNLTFISFEGLTFLLFLYFVYIDLKTLASKNRTRRIDLENIEKYSSKGKLLINKAYNIFYKVPFENSLLDTLKIYLLRIIMIIVVLLPLYLFQVGLFLFKYAPMPTATILLVILFGSALLYQFDTKAGKSIETYVLKYLSMLRPENIESIKRNYST